MTDELARFFSRNRFQVGFSLDGPREIHDLHRRFQAGGAGTFDAVMGGIDRYRRHSRHELIAVIAVVTPFSAGRAREIFEFFK